MPSTGRPFLRALRFSGALLALACLFPSLASAQYFGRNRVRYEKFDWQILKTEHFDVYYYPEEEQGVRDAARMAERWYERLSSVFGREFSERKSIILYADQSDFQQTTLSRGAIGEGTGGFTESLRTRVVLPLTGNYEDTDHVIGHELVHVFQYDILREPTMGGRRSGGGLNLPLWFIEGLAEYLSLGREYPPSAMWLRDALIRDELPDLRKLSRNPRYFPYRWGHAFWAYVGGRWSDQAVGQLFVAGTQLGIEEALTQVLGLSSEDFSKAWQASIRESYAPVLAERLAPGSTGQRILPRSGESEERPNYISPVISPRGDEVMLFSTRGLFSFDLYLADARTGEIRERVVSENADPHLDSLRFLDSAGSWSPDGSRFAFVVAARGDNELAIVDVRSRRIERRIPVEGVGQMWNTSWSPDGRTIAFAGSSGGITDLYLHDLESGQTRRLTNDVFADLQPEWSPDGRTLAFVSDRGDRGRGTNIAELTYGPMAIWLLDIGGEGAGGAAGEPRPALPGFAGNQINPAFGPGGRELYFLSDAAGASDVYRVTLATGEVSRVTRISTGVTGISRLSPALSVSEQTGRLMFSVFRNAGYELYALDPEQVRAEPVAGGPAPAATWAAALPPVGGTATARQSIVDRYLENPMEVLQPRQARLFEETEYRPRLQLEFLGPAAGVGVSNLGYGFAGDVTAVFSDILGQREAGLSIQGTSVGDIQEVGAQGYFLNQAGRWQWGASGGHVPYLSSFTSVRSGTVEIDGQLVPADVIEQVRQTVTIDELSLIAHYPFTVTQRFETGIGATRLSYDNEVRRVLVTGNQVIDRDEDDLPSPESVQLYQGSVAFVGDSSLFGFTSPIQGRRYRIEVQPTFGDLQFQAVTADFRQYLFFRPVTLAMRGVHFGRYGSDAEDGRLAPLYVGRPTLVRGYEVGDIDPSECTPVAGSDACPEFDRLIGSRMAVANLEVRLPLFGVPGYGVFRTSFLPVEIGAFVDAGVAWTEDESPELRFEERSIERIPVVSAGVTARLLLGGFAVLEFYYAKPFQRPNEDWVTGFTIAPGW